MHVVSPCQRIIRCSKSTIMRAVVLVPGRAPEGALPAAGRRAGYKLSRTRPTASEQSYVCDYTSSGLAPPSSHSAPYMEEEAPAAASSYRYRRISSQPS